MVGIAEDDKGLMMLDLKTVNDVLVRVTGRGDRTVMLWQDAAGGLEADYFG